MIKINKEDKETLYSYSEIFKRIELTKSLKGATRKDSKIIAEIVNKYSDTKKVWNFNCNSCVFSLWTKAAQIYNNIKIQDEKRRAKEKKQSEKVESKA